MTREAGKGDTTRPTNWDHFSENFDRIFGKKPPKKELRDRIGMMPIEDAHRLFGKDGELGKKQMIGGTDVDTKNS
jgi:hypothetical protein